VAEFTAKHMTDEELAGSSVFVVDGNVIPALPSLFPRLPLTTLPLKWQEELQERLRVAEAQLQQLREETRRQSEADRAQAEQLAACKDPRDA
jgi:hypothetical protein